MLTFACTGDVGAVVSGAEIVAGRQGIGGGAPGTDGLMRGTYEASCLHCHLKMYRSAKRLFITTKMLTMLTFDFAGGMSAGAVGARGIPGKTGVGAFGDGTGRGLTWSSAMRLQ